MERETGFEPATPSLEGSRSSQLSYSRLMVCVSASAPETTRATLHREPLCSENDACGAPEQFARIRWWGEEDSNLRRHEPTDLQSAPFGRLGISPKFRNASLAFSNGARSQRGSVELAEGIEPPTR